MASFNKVVLVGNLTRDVELKQLQSGMSVADLGLAINEKIKQGNEWVESTCFVDVTFFGKTADVCSQYLSKGSSILVDGRLRYESWERDGQKRSKLKVIGERMQMLGGRGDGSNRQRQTAPDQYSESVAPSRPSGPPEDDDVPF